MDSVSEQRLSLVWPILADSIRIMADTLAQKDILIRVVQGLRTSAEQDALYEQGRTTPGKIVTNCRGGFSWHNFGMAVDCVPSTSIDFFNPDWNPSHPAWKEMEAQAKGLGLTCGADWRSFPDYPHFQLTGQYPEGAPSDEVREIAAASGLAALWATVKL